MSNINYKSLSEEIIEEISEDIAGNIKDNIHEIRFDICYDKNGEIIREESEAARHLERKAVEHLFDPLSNIVTGVIKIDNSWCAEVSCDMTHNIKYVKIANA